MESTVMKGLAYWSDLAASTQADEREDVSIEECEDASATNLSSIQAAIHTELLVLTSHAKKLADGFWELNRAIREEGDGEQVGYFGTRVRLRGNSLSIDWYRNYFIQDKSTGAKRPMSKHIAKGEGFRYSRHSFKGAKEWESEAIEVIENQYAQLRKRADILRTMRRLIGEYETTLNSMK